MIKSFTATTREIDDPELAAKEILAALDIEKNLLKHSVGLISCFSEFADTGSLKAVCDALPFDCVGTTTCICSCNGETDQIILAITVLTSDDCCFDALAIPMDAQYDASIRSTIGEYFSKHSDRPELILTFVPLINSISGDMMLAAVDKVTDGIPLFGTVAIDHLSDYASSSIVYNGEAYREMLTMVGIRGPVKYKFESAALNEERIRKQKAIITASSGNILIGVNGISAVEYLSQLGLTKEEIATGIGVLPLIIDHKNGTKPVARAVFALTDEGHAVCGGTMPVNASLSVGQVNKDDVLATTETSVKDIMDGESVILSFSCIARYMVLGIENTAEAEKFKDTINSNYLFVCSGGEICPLPNAEGKLQNVFHNYTIALCRLG